ncbi:MarR family winged helix-turn-helix transcriptional regulator [Paenibacillus sp. IHBB 3054]|uniref:MarR family winged helix-turn-helix transcriptional regulator n=1 Tax=Paenibacillus sp. IHBB 3054 TaxID=3425689 RepID=UPI003F669EA6
MDSINDVLINLQCELVAERNRVNPKEINWLQYDILHLLSQQKWQLPSEMSTSLGISRTKLSKALKVLKQMGYITQKPSEMDGRELVTLLTDAGQELLDGVEIGHNHLSVVASKLFTEEEQTQLAKLVNQLSNALRSERMRVHE